MGGPSTAGAAWVPAFLAYAAERQVPVDFVTTHTYCVDHGFIDEQGQSDQKLSPSPDSIVGDIRRVREQIQASAAPGLPLHFTEWSTSYNPRDSVHDSYHGASYVLTKVKDGSYFTKVQPAAELPPLAIALSNMKPRCIRGSHPSHRLQTK